MAQDELTDTLLRQSILGKFDTADVPSMGNCSSGHGTADVPSMGNCSSGHGTADVRRYGQLFGWVLKMY